MTVAEFFKDWENGEGFTDDQLLLLAERRFLDLRDGKVDEEEISRFEMPMLAEWIDSEELT